MENKVVLITGASRGIGAEIAYKFALEKANLILTYYKDKGDGEDVADKCRELGSKYVLLLNLNVMDDKSISSTIKKSISKFKKIDILVNNAGIAVWKPLKEQSFLDIENQIRTNLEGLIKFTSRALPYLKEMIINIASGAGKTGFAGLTSYCATKFGVRGFTQALAAERPKMRIYSLNPGLTATRLTGYEGISPKKVAEVVIKTARGRYDIFSGGDVDVWDKV